MEAGRRPRRVGVLGTFVWDTIWTLEDQAAGRPLETWGGMTYSLAAAAAFRPPGWEIVPIAKVGSDLAERVHALLASLAGVVDGPGIRIVPQANNRVELRYLDAARRDEQMRGGVPGWEWGELEPVLEGLDALYVNFLSGWELSLDAAGRLRGGFGGPVYADLHSLFLGPPGHGAREPRRLLDWERWLACFHAVQLNADELALLGDGSRPLSPRDLLRFGPALAAVTLGPEGAAWAARADLPADPLRWPNLPSDAPAEVSEGRQRPPRVDGGDPTGCGDVWGATFFLSLLGGADQSEAAARANAAAAAKLSHRGASGLYEHLSGGAVGGVRPNR